MQIKPPMTKTSTKPPTSLRPVRLIFIVKTVPRCPRRFRLNASHYKAPANRLEHIIPTPDQSSMSVIACFEQLPGRPARRSEHGSITKMLSLQLFLRAVGVGLNTRGGRRLCQQPRGGTIRGQAQHQRNLRRARGVCAQIGAQSGIQGIDTGESSIMCEKGEHWLALGFLESEGYLSVGSPCPVGIVGAVPGAQGTK
jgi:hypothetical protein